MSTAALGRTRFIEEMVAWLNQRFSPAGGAFREDSLLFADGFINSIRILELIAWTERAIGMRIPDARIRMDNFQSVRRIAEIFVAEEGPCSAPR